MRDLLETVVTNVESVSLRSVPGHGEQVELTITAKRGALTMRLLARTGKTIRVMDLRAKDKQKHRRLVTVPQLRPTVGL